MIVSAAVIFQGKTYTGRRHSDCIHTAFLETGIRPINGEQGFLTDDGKFLNRIEAAEYAFEHGQVKKKITHYLGLFSEDLW